MADVSGLVISALAISFEIASTLYSYGKDVKGAKKEIQSISNELFGLIGVLEHLKSRHDQGLDDDITLADNSEFADSRSSTNLVKEPQSLRIESGHYGNVDSVLSQTIGFLQDLQSSLRQPKGRLAEAVHLMKWPLKKGDLSKHLQRLERVKTYFVLSLVTDEADQSRITANEINDLRIMMQEASLEQKVSKSQQQYAEIMAWLSPVDPSLMRTSISRIRTPGTGEWLTRSKAFTKWRQASTSSTFWLNGITGSGKSTLTTTMIDELLVTQKSHDIAYFYCSFSNDQTLHTQHILGSLLAQICSEYDALYEDLRSMYIDARQKTLGKPSMPEIDVLSSLLKMQADTRHLYILIDGINECGDPYEILQSLNDISKDPSNIRLFLSSINEKGIENYVSAMPALCIETLRPEDIKHDISMLVLSTLELQPRLRQLPQNLKHDIVRALSKGAQGMFRWVQCQLDVLSRLRTPGAVRKALGSLPPTLDKTYEDMLLRIDGEEDMDLTRQILQILAFSLRPLRLHEVCTALQITPGMPALDESKCLNNPKDLLSICGSLLKCSGKTGKVTLAHHSVLTYLTSDLRGKVARFRLSEKEAHRELALLSLSYLSYEAFSTDPSELPNNGQGLYEEFDFLDYAVQMWPLHIQAAGDLPDELWTVLRSFLLSAESGRQNFIAWVQLLIPQSSNAKSTPPLYYASSFGLTTAVRYLLEMNVDIEARGGRGGATSINIAAFRGHLDVVKLLLEHGADPLKPDIETDLNAVQWATYKNHNSITGYFEHRGYPFEGAEWYNDAKLEWIDGSWRLRKPPYAVVNLASQTPEPRSENSLTEPITISRSPA